LLCLPLAIARSRLASATARRDGAAAGSLRESTEALAAVARFVTGGGDRGLRVSREAGIGKTTQWEQGVGAARVELEHDAERNVTPETNTHSTTPLSER
jgi:hypothetical protein